jgi:hypothetical protein
MNRNKIVLSLLLSGSFFAAENQNPAVSSQENKVSAINKEEKKTESKNSNNVKKTEKPKFDSLNLKNVIAKIDEEINPKIKAKENIEKLFNVYLKENSAYENAQINLKIEQGKKLTTNKDEINKLTLAVNAAKEKLDKAVAEIKKNQLYNQILLKNEEGFVASLKRFANGETQFMDNHKTIAKIFAWTKTITFFMAAGFIAKKIYDVVVPQSDFDSEEADSLKK